MTSIFPEYDDVELPPFNLDDPFWPDIVKWAISFLQEESGDFVLSDESTEILALTLNRVFRHGQKNPTLR